MAVGVGKWRDKRLNIRFFDSKQTFIDQAQAAIAQNEQKIKDDYRDKVKEFLLTGMLGETQFQNFGKNKKESKQELDGIMERMENLKAKIDMGGAFKKARLRITSDQRGVFSFGIASKGLYRPMEYFSKELAVDSPQEFATKPSGVVPADKAEAIAFFSEKQFWYTSKSGQRYRLHKQQEGTREIELGTRTGLVFRSANRKSYVLFEKKGGKAKMVELYIPLHGEITLENIIPLFLVARYLRENNILTRICIIRMFHEQYDYFYLWGYPIKEYGEEFDYNAMALNAVDRRWWYSVQVMVRALSDQERGRATTGGSGDPAGRTVAPYLEAFSRYKNWYLDQIKQGFIPPLRIDKKLMFMGGVYTSQTTDAAIIGEFFRIMDSVDLQFAPVNECCKRIYKRMVEEELQKRFEELSAAGRTIGDREQAMATYKKKYTVDFKTYLTMLLRDTYTYPEDGAYPEDPESARKMEGEFEDKIEQLNLFLKNL